MYNALCQLINRFATRRNHASPSPLLYGTSLLVSLWNGTGKASPEVENFVKKELAKNLEYVGYGYNVRIFEIGDELYSYSLYKPVWTWYGRSNYYIIVPKSLKDRTHEVEMEKENSPKTHLLRADTKETIRLPKNPVLVDQFILAHELQHLSHSDWMVNAIARVCFFSAFSIFALNFKNFRTRGKIIGSLSFSGAWLLFKGYWRDLELQTDKDATVNFTTDELHQVAASFRYLDKLYNPALLKHWSTLYGMSKIVPLFQSLPPLESRASVIEHCAMPDPLSYESDEQYQEALISYLGKKNVWRNQEVVSGRGAQQQEDEGTNS